MFKVGNFRIFSGSFFCIFFSLLLRFISALLLPFRLSQKGTKIYFERVYEYKIQFFFLPFY